LFIFCLICVFGVFSVVLFELSVPVQVIAWKDSSLKWPIMCWAGRKTLLTHLAVLWCWCVNTGDDEQSDFYCEPDYPCASGLMAASMIAGARSRWKREQFPSDSHMSRLHHDVCNLM